MRHHFTPRRPASAVVALALLPAAVGVAGCGGGGEESKAKDAVNAFIDAGKHPSAKLCDVLSQRFIEQRTGLKGDAATKKCRTNADKAGSAGRSAPFPKGIKLTKAKVSGDTAEVSASAPGQGTGVFHLVKEGGSWKVDSAK